MSAEDNAFAVMVLGIGATLIEVIIGIPFIGWVEAGVIGIIIGLIGVVAEASEEGEQYTHKCPSCGAYWNVNTGENVIEFSDNKLQCDECGATEYV